MPYRYSNILLCNIRIRQFVLDEGDKLFELGFVHNVDEILSFCVHPRITRCLCSATLPEQIESLVSTLLRDPIRIIVGRRYGSVLWLFDRIF